MILFFQKQYTLFCNNNILLDTLRINSLFRHFWLYVANVVIPFWFIVTKKNPNNKIPICKSEKKRIIASLTTYPGRIDKLWIVIESILRQTRKPDMLILWLSQEQFRTLNALPDRLLKQQDRGLIIKLRNEDLRSHKKYYYVLKEFPNDHLLTFDDDIIYPENAIEDIVSAWTKYPSCVVGRYSNQIQKDQNDRIIWLRTKKEEVRIPSNKIFIGSGGGTLYPSHSLPKQAMDKVFMKICKTADDVWLNSMLRFNDIKIIALSEKCPLLSVLYKENHSLSEINMGTDHLNGVQINAVRAFCIEHGKDPFLNL